MAARIHETTVLLADDDPAFLRSVARLLPDGMQHKLAYTVAEAIAVMRSGVALHGCATGVRFANSSGFTIRDVWSATRPGVPSLVMMGPRDKAMAINRASCATSHLLARPFGRDHFQVFTSDVTARRWRVPAAVAEPFAAFVREQNLTRKQAELFALHENGVGQARTAVELGVSVNTVKTRVRQLREKLEVSSLDALHARMIAAFVRSTEGATATLPASGTFRTARQVKRPA
jgi:FixJ family two-component response regulator